MGRPTKCSTEVTLTICNAIRAGNYAGVAAKFAGISETTFYDWLRRGALSEEPYAEFADEVAKAEADAHVRAVAMINKTAFEDRVWQAHAWWLERKFPELWGKKDRLDLNANVETAFIMKWPDADQNPRDLCSPAAPAAALGEGAPSAVEMSSGRQTVGQESSGSSDGPGEGLRR